MTKLSTIIRAAFGDNQSKISELVAGFEFSYSQFLYANNRKDLEESAVLADAIKHKTTRQALLDAIRLGDKASGLESGHIGARMGAFSKQSAEYRAPYEAALKSAVSAFRETLEASEAFKAVIPLTEAEKEAKKAEAEAKKAEAIESVISAKIANGELVKAENIKVLTLEEFSLSALVDHVQTRLSAGEAITLQTRETIAAIVKALKPVKA